ncbi:MAG TPA: acyltransferase [Acidimicrobiales bacterium]|nr:acyltransferase [Acidimicrobiales bacterium]
MLPRGLWWGRGGAGALGNETITADLPRLAAVEVRLPAVAAVDTGTRAVGLDGLRALAVLGIVVYHGVFLLPATWHVAYPLAQHLDAAVEVFFVLSGYLIYGPFARAHVRGRPPPRLRGYLLRRAVRIYPAYLVAVGGLLLFGWIHFDDTAQLVQHLTLTQGYFPRDDASLFLPAGLGQSWTLVVEVSFYAFVPAWAWAMRRLARAGGLDGRRQELAGVAVLLAAGTAAAVIAAENPLPVPFAVLPPHLVGLGWGMLLAVVTVDGRPAWLQRRRPARVPTTELCWIGACATLVVLSYLQQGFDYEPGDMLVRHALKLLAAALLVTPVVLGGATVGLVPRLLSWRPLVTVGVVSYGIYLWHLDVLADLPGPWHEGSPTSSAVAMGARAAVALAFGAASFYVLERPLMKWAGRTSKTDTALPRESSSSAASPVLSRSG